MNWNELNIKQRLMLHKSNMSCNPYLVKKERFAVGAFVREKKNGVIRFITSIPLREESQEEYFLDDGEVSLVEPSPHCHYENYIMI